MLKIAQNQMGVSMLELMIAIVIGLVLLMMGIPSFQSWIQNTQIRTAAESILNGLQVARTEAVHSNKNVRFMLTDASGANATSGKVAWTVCLSEPVPPAACPVNDVLQSRAGNEGGSNATVKISIASYPSGTPPATYFSDTNANDILPAGVTFDGLGRVPANSQSSNARRMVIVIRTGGQVRMCDPALALATNPQGCS
jgi:type IV fimbrial biogenesis protein FimT